MFVFISKRMSHTPSIHRGFLKRRCVQPWWLFWDQIFLYLCLKKAPLK